MKKSPPHSDNHAIATKTLVRRMEQVIDLVQRAGYVPYGWTSPRVVGEHDDGSKIITPPRRRFRHYGKDDYVTVGMKLVYFYQRGGAGDVECLASFNTPDIDQTATYLLNTRR